MGLLSRVKTWIEGDTLTASDLNAEFDNIVNTGLAPAYIDDDSANAAGMQATVDPYPANSESLATTLAGEIERLRYVIKQITGESQWYIDPDNTIASMNTSIASISAIGNPVGGITNLSLSATVSGKALTVNALTAAAATPSSGSPVTISFRAPTATGSGTFNRTITGALSVVLSSGSTLGFTAAEAGRLYVWAIDNAGTVELALSRTADIFPESVLVSTTAEGGAGAADSAAVMYSTSARSNVACRCIGYIEITTGATAGEWDNAPTVIQVMGPGVRRTGDIVQIRSSIVTAYVSTTTQIPFDDTIPQKTEGDEITTVTLYGAQAINNVYANFSGFGDTAGAARVTTALFQDDTAGALAARGQHCSGSQVQQQFLVSYSGKVGVTGSTTFKVRLGTNSASAAHLNGDNAIGGRVYGGVGSAELRVMEVFA